ncbi:MAG: hypoxanthine phosphoribosyltransferase [Candidatus Eisenbacteria bacterium]|uniref:Hypoxanthine phosphoribosyltransferase n=1 Tax=Eiseniibacteriota bacterium TaxID=2212470 RepID=A0A538UAI6_UNCEI|nr:MAG: hypoxanthine phosphoribosyltransferase [Candidatus Eisenbacteria bacterium]
MRVAQYCRAVIQTPTVPTQPAVRVLFSAEQIATRVREMGLTIARDLGPRTRAPIFVGVLKGACLFIGDLARATPLDVEFDFATLSSYGSGTTSSGNVRLESDLRNDIAGRDVLVCEGVVDSGQSLAFLIDLLGKRKPASIRIAALLDKVPCRKVEVPVDYAGWRIGDEFVVGYGMDYDERYRSLPYVGILETP